MQLLAQLQYKSGKSFCLNLFIRVEKILLIPCFGNTELCLVFLQGNNSQQCLVSYNIMSQFTS